LREMTSTAYGVGRDSFTDALAVDCHLLLCPQIHSYREGTLGTKSKVARPVGEGALSIWGVGKLRVGGILLPAERQDPTFRIDLDLLTRRQDELGHAARHFHAADFFPDPDRQRHFEAWFIPTELDQITT